MSDHERVSTMAGMEKLVVRVGTAYGDGKGYISAAQLHAGELRGGEETGGEDGEATHEPG